MPIRGGQMGVRFAILARRDRRRSSSYPGVCVVVILRNRRLDTGSKCRGVGVVAVQVAISVAASLNSIRSEQNCGIGPTARRVLLVAVQQLERDPLNHDWHAATLNQIESDAVSETVVPGSPCCRLPVDRDSGGRRRWPGR